MRSLTFTVHFADDIGTEEANTEIAQNLAADLESILRGYSEPDALGDGGLLELGRAFGIAVAQEDGSHKDVRVTTVHWTGGA